MLYILNQFRKVHHLNYNFSLLRRTARIHLEELNNLNKVDISYIKSKGAKVWKIKN